MSKLDAIRAMLQKALMAFERISTDKALIESDDEEIVVGSAVHGVDEEGNSFDLEDGDYTTSEGVVYVVKEGKVDEIREPENIDEPAEESFSLIHRMAVKFESFLEKEDKIRAGLAAKGIDGWLVDAGDDFVVVGVWNDEEMQDKFWKYDVSWDEDGNAIIGEGEEVKNAFVPVDEDVEKNPVEENFEEEESKDDQIANLEAEIARLEEENGALKEENAELKDRIAELEEKSAAEPAAEEFNKVNTIEKTGDAKLDRLINRFKK